MTITEQDLSEVYDGEVLSASGEKIGSVGQIYLDDQTGEPTFVTANTGMFGLSQSFVPLRGARVENGNVIVDFDKTTVKDAPRIDDDGSLSPAEEDQLYAYYGMGTASLDTADYGTDDQTPEPGYARADRDDDVSGESRLGDRTADRGADSSPGDRDVRSHDWGDRPAGAEERTAAAGTAESDGIAREGSGGFGALDAAGGAGRDDRTMSDAPLADRGRADADRGEERTGEQGGQSRRSRLRKWVMTEYEPVKSEEVYLEGSGQSGERPAR